MPAFSLIPIGPFPDTIPEGSGELPMVSIDTLIAEVGKKIRQCPKQTLKDAYTKAARAFSQQTQWVRTNFSTTLVVDQDLYSMTADADVEIIGAIAAQITNLPIVNSTPQITPLGMTSTESWDANLLHNRPARAAYVTEGMIAFNPKPDKAYPVKITMLLQVQLGANNLPVSLITKWRDQIEAGALEYLYSIDGEPWTNPNESAKQGAIFRAGINNAKAAVQRGFQVGAIRARPRPFIC